ncbi:MAG: GNAT family N-acetyltransferase [Roseiflexaceae bacterium]
MSEALPFPLGQGSTTITSKRGRQVHVRHIRATDDTLLIDLFHRLSDESRRLRFHSPVPNYPDTFLRDMAHRMADLDPHQADALIATVQEEGHERAIGVARLAVDPDDQAIVEGAIVIRDDYQGEGIGSVLFDLIVQVAIVRGHRFMRALSLVENRAVHRLIERLGLPYSSQTSRGEVTTMIRLA